MTAFNDIGEHSEGVELGTDLIAPQTPQKVRERLVWRSVEQPLKAAGLNQAYSLLDGGSKLL